MNDIRRRNGGFAGEELPAKIIAAGNSTTSTKSSNNTFSTEKGGTQTSNTADTPAMNDSITPSTPGNT